MNKQPWRLRDYVHLLPMTCRTRGNTMGFTATPALVSDILLSHNRLIQQIRDLVPRWGDGLWWCHDEASTPRSDRLEGLDWGCILPNGPLLILSKWRLKFAWAHCLLWTHKFKDPYRLFDRRQWQKFNVGWQLTRVRDFVFTDCSKHSKGFPRANYHRARFYSAFV